jgi:hypothetical protein
MTRWDVFRLVGDALASRLFLSRPVSLPAPPIPWPLVVEAAGEHLVAPALGWCLHGDERVPADVRQCFEVLLELNRQRNAIIQQALEHAVASLNDAAVTPMLLKGAAALVEGLYPDPGMRVVGDLDLLVRQHEIAAADAALERAGFGLEAPLAGFDGDPHHLLPRVHAELRVRVDLHVRPTPGSIPAVLDASEMLDRGRSRIWRGRQVLIPDASDWMIHNILHGQIVDGHYWRGIPRLRQLAELEALARRYPDAWTQMRTDARIARARCGRIFAETMLLTEVLLGRTDPALVSAGAARVVERTRRAVERPSSRRWSVYRQILIRNARRVIRHPGFAIRPLRPSFWSRYGARIRERTQVRRW